jgi:hypothetical protein
VRLLGPIEDETDRRFTTAPDEDGGVIDDVFIDLATRRVHVAGITINPDGRQVGPAGAQPADAPR